MKEYWNLPEILFMALKELIKKDMSFRSLHNILNTFSDQRIRGKIGHIS